MEFSSNLQGQASHEALLNRQDAEIKLLDTMRKCIAAKIKSDREYASNIVALSSQGKKVERSEELSGSIIMQGWKEIMESFDQTARLIRLQADSMENLVLEHITSLYSERKKSRKSYQEEQNWLNNQFRELTDEVSRKKGEYQKNLENYRQMRSRFEDNYVKSGKVGRKLDEVRDKYQKACRKLHLTHNEYVLLLGAVAECECDLRTFFLPNLLKKQQHNHQDFIITWKKILQNVVKYTDFTNEKFLEIFTSLKKTIDYIKPTLEYQEFIGKHGTRPLSPIEFIFNEHLVDDTSGKLLPNKITVDNLTIDWLRNRLTELEISLSNVPVNRLTAQSSTEGCDMKCNIEFLQEEIKSRCAEKKLQKQIEIIRAALNELGCEEAPAGCDISVEGSFLDSLNNKVSLPEVSSCDYQKNAVSSELANEDWFHGVLPREDVVRLLVNKGDFLVRESIRNNESQIVLSVRWINSHKHFIVQTTQERHFRFEGPAFPSITDLILHQYNNKVPVTSRSGAVLLTPIVRERWELNNDDVILIDKIGHGNFGDVYKARLRPSNMDVAVKTCKGTLPDEQRKKFLQEGRILKRYDHPNIVKFIGICVQKQPVMIVMELVPGGSLITYLRNNAPTITQQHRLLMCKDTAAGMRYLESKSCIHRDLAARNCLVGHNTIIKISDFGMSREEEEYIVSDGMKQIPIKWTAPEALNFGKYTSLCDVWSYGVLMWEIFSLGSSPYPGMSNMQARQKIEEGYRMSPPDGTPDEIYRLMLQCWKPNPEERPHFEKIHTVIDSLLRQ